MNQKIQSVLIKCLMCAHEISGAELARQSGFSRSQVSRVILGHSRSPEIENTLSRELGKPLSELFPNWYAPDGSRIQPKRLSQDERMQALSALTVGKSYLTGVAA